MKRPRPGIPVSVRVKVAERMAAEKGGAFWMFYQSRLEDKSKPFVLKKRLGMLLRHLFGEEESHLDHDPALVLREFNDETGKYTPDANDPAYLVYRTKRNHLQKTVGRKEDAEKTVTTKGSDAWLAKKLRKHSLATSISVGLHSDGKFRKRKIPSRPFQRRKHV